MMFCQDCFSQSLNHGSLFFYFMRFAHLADVHIGAWRDPSMKNLSLKAFSEAVSTIIREKIDFVIIAGDLFNTALPAIDQLQETVIILKKLKKAFIPVYVVFGSHDYNASGSSIIDVLEETELLINVSKQRFQDGKIILDFVKDEKTGSLITGFGGKKGGFDKDNYKRLLIQESSSDAFRIFVFHSSIDELKPSDLELMDSMPANNLPSGFDYYAGGHVHIVAHKNLDNRKNVIYPGPLFPASFSELWKLEKGGFYIYDSGKIIYHPLEIRKVLKLEEDASKKTPLEINDSLLSRIKSLDLKGCIVMLKIFGKLSSGKPGDVDFRGFFRELYSRGAFFVMRNTSQLSSVELERIEVSSGTSEEVEDMIISSRVLESEGSPFGKEELSVVKRLINALSAEQQDGEKKYEYDSRMKKETDNILKKKIN
jgi:DNA repair exonuclease SbcCD nuclease subunit